MSRLSAVLSLSVSLATASAGGAVPLLVHGPGLAPPSRGGGTAIGGLQPLVLDGAALADLRTRDTAVLDDFPLGGTRLATLVVSRFSPFAPGARVEVMDAAGSHDIPLPDAAYFRGTVAGEPESRVLLIAGPDDVHGFVASGGDVFPFGRNAAGTHVTYALRDASAAFFPPPSAFCANDLEPDAVQVPDRPRAPAADVPPVAGTVLKQAEIAIETDQELRAKFTSDQETLDYLSNLLAASTAIYQRDVSVELLFSYVRIWDTTDPWTATSTGNALTEFRRYWNANMTGLARDVAHMISGKAVQGGIAYVDVLCNGSYGYGVSQVYGSFDLSDPNQIWDVLVVTHELGHNFGSPHSHCYSPPVDMCYNQEAGCYSGPVVASRGTIMSYCHLLAGGLSNIDLVFGDVVSNRIATSVAAASCLTPVTTTTTTTTDPSATTTTTAATTTSTTSASTTTTAARTTTTTTRRRATSTTTTTTLPPPGGAGDQDGDGVPDVIDACPNTPPADLVDARGCSLCPCDGPTGGGWPSRRAYLRCIQAAMRHASSSTRLARRIGFVHARDATCGRDTRTRCCSAGGTCRIVSPGTCAARGGRDVGAGSCHPSPC